MAQANKRSLDQICIPFSGDSAGNSDAPALYRDIRQPSMFISFHFYWQKQWEFAVRSKAVF